MNDHFSSRSYNHGHSFMCQETKLSLAVAISDKTQSHGVSDVAEAILLENLSNYSPIYLPRSITFLFLLKGSPRSNIRWGQATQTRRQALSYKGTQCQQDYFEQCCPANDSYMHSNK